ncbi:hypothetical protein Clacol_010181 [Clathrus columnatus]|uniref:Uncharacterized protein n=1 Tax=Clathrus columnatus TaxID=1419009 RepID=A0AAV5AQW4_9AGAM|nr:hypothetical protein Clacol_010181 [Clathrus columnatus]
MPIIFFIALEFALGIIGASYNRRAIRTREASDTITTTGIVVRTNRTTDADAKNLDLRIHSSSPRQQSTLVPTRSEPKPPSDAQNIESVETWVEGTGYPSPLTHGVEVILATEHES